MRLVLLTLFQCIVFSAGAQLEQLRSQYFVAGSTDDGKRTFYQMASTLRSTSATEDAYKGVAIAMYADLADGVQQKFEYFNKGRDILEAAISKDPWNAELRFLRFSVQAEVPWIVDYHDNLNEDADYVILALQGGHVDPRSDYWKNAIAFMLRSDELTSKQEQELRKFVF